MPITSPRSPPICWRLLIISYLHIVGGELAPKVFAFHKPVELSLLVARPINFLYRAMAWVIWLLNASATGLLWICGQRQMTGPGGGHFSISEEELRTILAASEQEGVLKPHETKMIHGVFDLDDQTAHDLMVPRTQIVALPNTATIRDALEVFRQSKHSRFPVYKDTIDTIVGTLFIKELLESIDPRGGPASLERPITEIMRPPYIVPETKPISLLLARFKAKRQQMAIVADEFGGTAGLVTLEDILEEIVGEYEDEASLQTEIIRRKTDDGCFFVDPGRAAGRLGSADRLRLRARDVQHVGRIDLSPLGPRGPSRRPRRFTGIGNRRRSNRRTSPGRSLLAEGAAERTTSWSGQAATIVATACPPFERRPSFAAIIWRGQESCFRVACPLGSLLLPHRFEPVVCQLASEFASRCQRWLRSYAESRPPMTMLWSSSRKTIPLTRFLARQMRRSSTNSPMTASCSHPCLV